MKLIRFPGAALAAFALLACGGVGSPGGVTLSEFVGTWEALRAEWRSPEDALIRADLNTLDASLTLVIAADGRYTTELTVPAGTETETGSVALRGGRLRFTPDGPGRSVEFVFSLRGSFLQLTTRDASFDFDGDGIEEPALLEMDLRRL